MAINLNNAIVQGYVVSVYEGEGNAKVTLVVRDDYKNRDGDAIERPYFMPITFFGQQAENLVRLVQEKAFLTVQFKVTSYKPQDAEFHVLSLVGLSFYLTPRPSGESDSASRTNNTGNKNGNNNNRNANKNNNGNKRNNNNSNSNKRGDRTTRDAPVNEVTDGSDDWGDLPPWGDDN